MSIISVFPIYLYQSSYIKCFNITICFFSALYRLHVRMIRSQAVFTFASSLSPAVLTIRYHWISGKKAMLLIPRGIS